MTAAPDDTPWLTEGERAAWLAVAALIIKLPNALDGQLQADHGLSFFEYMVLAVLSEQPDRTLQMSDIASATSSSLSRLSHTAKRLEKQGLLRRERVPGPGRRTAAILTDAGHTKVAEAAPSHVRRVRELLVDAVTPDQLRTLNDVGRTVIERIDPPGSACPANDDTCRTRVQQ
ncbi:MarR family winged helix-turn-helix transcriptional regulator [Gordonia crocea]|uniref:MarR family transcriptional regulator n=1 Tax=Gordonia crocea TaxID=589162 RepID=A0A7M3SUX4_9ACTN|nr:MarR family transcriptional regulator [Gordonia crocea]GED96448.1 MarR family transcriptional regulator [Gordonia crocea]